jgi:VWFA-related protein
MIGPMRVPALLLAMVCPLLAQFQSTVPLVVAPATVTDGKGRFVDGLTADDLTLYDNNVRQKLQLEDTFVKPISLVVVIEASSRAAAVLDKVRGSGVLFSDLLSGEAGETAIVSFSDHVRVSQDFTTDSSRLTKALKALRVQGDGATILDGIGTALRLLARRDRARRRVILVIAERRDRSSRTDLPALLREVQSQNVAVFWLTYSTFLEPFTNRQKTVWDRMSDEEKAEKHPTEGKHPFPSPEEETPLPPEMAPGSLITIFTELKQRAKIDAAELFSRTTGARTFRFLKRSGLEEAIQAMGEEVHRQYVISYQPAPDKAGIFHAMRMEVKGRPDLQVRTRAGYWSVE